MAGILSGLSKFGLSDLAEAKVYEEEQEKVTANAPTEGAAPVLLEKDFLYDKAYDCPVCSHKTSAKAVRSAKLKLVGNDRDLRAIYEGIDIHKYDAVVCTYCGYAALGRYYQPLLQGQIKLVKDSICSKIKWQPHLGETYSYEEALERYQLVLACAIVKRAKSSEKAYICLKTAWAVRGYQEELRKNPVDEKSAEKLAELKKSEEEYLKNALDGFVNAKMNEGYPIANMDQFTLDLLLAELYAHFKDYAPASKLVSNILIAPGANKRIKDRARDLKEEILQGMKRG